MSDLNVVKQIDELYAKAAAGEFKWVSDDETARYIRLIHNAWPQIRDAIESLRRDGERWRFVRDCGLEEALIVTEFEGDELDAAIDDAMKQTGGE